MKTFGLIFAVTFLVLTGMCLVIPVSAAMDPTTNATKPFITVTTSPAAPSVGDIVTISGTATGGNLTPGVQLWIFAGNYVNVTHIPVNPDGSYARTFNSSGYPPAYYYIFVQHPGADTKFNIDITGFAGQVINENTGKVIFNFTGTGNVNDTAAAKALSTAFNEQGIDDIYVKGGFDLLAPGAAVQTTGPVPKETLVVKNASPVTTKAPVSPPVTVQNTPATTIPATTKAPLSPVIVITSFVLSGIIGVLSGKR
jgi:hypothetical protein